MRSHLLAAALALLLAGTALGAGEPAEPAGDAGIGQQAEPPFQPRWFFIMGTSNYHVRLEESEDQIDRQLDGTLGRVLPRWRRPTTFKDWSDDWRLWDLWAGFGRDINERFSWAAYGGGGRGTIGNRERYFPLGLPLRLDADFTRRSYFLGTSITWYPWGKPPAPDGTQTGHGFGRVLRTARPSVELNAGISRQEVIGDVAVAAPLAGNLLRVRQDDTYHLLWGSPRAAIEMALTDRDSVNLMTGYTFFARHGAEFDNVLLQVFWRRRF